jgi:hypothetical protein
MWPDDRERLVADELLPSLCPECGGRNWLIALVTEVEPVRRIRDNIAQPASPLPISPARSLAVGDTFRWDQTSAHDSEPAEPAPDFEYDQTVSCSFACRPAIWGQLEPLCLTTGPAPL